MSAQVEVRLPELADAMASATLAAWLKKPGDTVTAGEPIAEVETDKTTVELEAPADGVLDIRVAAGTRDVKIGALLAVVREGARAGEKGPTADSAPPLIEVRLPELADAMTSATLTAWLKEPGDTVTAGEPIAEVETDKTTVELEAPAGGVLAEIRVAAGAEAVAVDTVLALLHQSRTAASGTQGASAGAATAPPGAAGAPAAEAPEVPLSSGSDAAAASPAWGSDTRHGAGDGPVRRHASATESRDPLAQSAAIAPVPDVPATPLARRMAELAGLDLGSVTGSGDGGRVMKVDVERLLRSTRERTTAPVPADTPAAEPAAPTAPIPAPVADLPHSDRPLTAMRRVTAQRMTEAKQSAPHFYLEIECAVDALLALRDAANPADGAGPPTLNDVVVRAAALALREVPLANSAWIGDAVRVYERVDLAVAVTTPGGLVTPVVRAADAKPLAEIAAELRRLAADARAGRLQPADYQGGTCTISNLGMYGVSSLYAILNPPQSCILGVGAVTERPVVRDGAVVVGSMMTVTLSADHRAIDGATGAELLRALKARLEIPHQLFEQYGRVRGGMAIGKAAQLREKLEKIERSDIVAGIERMDTEPPKSQKRRSTGYDLLYKDRTYAPKEAVRYAYCEALKRRGEPPQDPGRVLSTDDGFYGGYGKGKYPLHANDVLKRLGFVIIQK